jgi:hypothetical protein
VIWVSGIVSGAVAPPVTNVVPVTVAVHDSPAIPRLSVMVTVPSRALVVPPGEVPGRAALAGAVIASRPPAIAIEVEVEVALVAVWLLASVTLTVKLKVPAAVGVPATTPVERSG